MNRLSETRRADYLFARMVARLEHTQPEVVVSTAAPSTDDEKLGSRGRSGSDAIQRAASDT
jgi:hypothetical protein